MERKNYLECSLTKEEKKLILGIIIMKSSQFKKRLYTEQTKKIIIPLESVIISSEDEYCYGNLEMNGDLRFIAPLSNIEKMDIVNRIDIILNELSLWDFCAALTFDEKLVLFFCSFKKYTGEQVAYLLQVNLNRIKYVKRTLKEKKNKFMGGIKNV